MQRAVIPLSKSKNVLALVGSAAFVALGCWLVGLDDAVIEAQRRFNVPWLVHGMGAVTIAFFGLAGIAWLRKLFDPAPGLVLDERGLTDNCSALSAGMIPWSDITGFQVRQIQSQRLLYVMLRDPDGYVARCGPVKRALLGINRRIAASPVALNTVALSIDFDGLVALVEQHFAAWRQREGAAYPADAS